MEFKAVDYNPWGNGNKNGDCVIRAICATTKCGYQTICDWLGVGKKVVMGHGYDGGITSEQLDKFIEKTGIIQKIWEDDMYAAWEKDGKSDFATEYYYGEDTLEFMADNFMDAITDNMSNPSSRFLVEVHSNKAKKPGDDLKLHMTTLFQMAGGKWMNKDISECRDVANAIPHRIYAVRKFCKPDSPIYWPTEAEKLRKLKSKELLSKRNAETSAATAV